ncbi:MAG: pilus assembly protein TadG-related protein [Actinomycetota bacterium]|nr:pilus assembly protein TadG-related protein [Actinomycetota bacterium]
MRRLVGDETAGVTPVAAVLVVVMLLVGTVLHDVTALYGARSIAQTAADAAAKAAGLELSPLLRVGSDPTSAARDYASRNGARLASLSYGGRLSYIWVTVRVEREVELLVMGGRRAKVSATARCYFDLAAQGRSLGARGSAPAVSR